MACFSAEAGEDLENGKVRFAYAVMSDTLPACYPQCWMLGNLFQERLDERGFADAGFARDENDLAFATKRFF
jgi:hypothetical protein